MNGNPEALTGIVGKSNVLDTPETLEIYSRDESYARPMKPRFVVKPEAAEEVQGIVRWANETGTPLVPLSSGPPHFYGDTVPGVEGAVIVDLSRMNRIIRINRRNRITIIEPGVTYGQLQPELAREGLRLSTPLLPRTNKSVVASLLERQPVLVPRFQWAILDPMRCVEVVWGDGNLFRTGEAGNQTSLEESWKSNFAQVTPRGPGQTDFYKFVSGAQGSMGIVTWASLKCEVLPELHKLYFVPARKLEDLIDLAYRLLKFRFGDEFLLLNSTSLASIIGTSADGVRALREKLPPWAILVGIAGRSILPKERVEFQEKDIGEIARSFGLKLLSEVPGAKGGRVLEKILNPSGETYWKLGYRGGFQDIFFMTTLNRTPDFLKMMHSLAEANNYPVADVGAYIQPVHQGVSCHCEFTLPFNPDSEAEAAGVKDLYTKASEGLLEQGAFFSLPYGIWADMAYSRDAKTATVLRKVKGIFDPNNVMNPGKLCFQAKPTREVQ